MAHALLARSARSGGLGVNLTPSSSYDLLNCCSLPLYLPLCVHLDLQERNHEAVLEIKGTEKLRKRARKYIKYVSVPPRLHTCIAVWLPRGRDDFHGVCGRSETRIRGPA